MFEAESRVTVDQPATDGSEHRPYRLGQLASWSAQGIVGMLLPIQANTIVGFIARRILNSDRIRRRSERYACCAEHDDVNSGDSWSIARATIANALLIAVSNPRVSVLPSLNEEGIEIPKSNQ